MMKLCPACEKLYIDANYLIEPEEGIPEDIGKCDGCRKKRWVKAVRVTFKADVAQKAFNQLGAATNKATSTVNAFSFAAKQATENAK